MKTVLKKPNLNKIADMIADMKILYIHKDKKRTIKQAYKVDVSKSVKIGGDNKDGYLLLVYPENTNSNTVITYIDCLKLLHGDIIKFENVTILNLNN